MKKIILILALCPAFSYGQTISTFAGTGSSAYSGDSGPATAAQLNEPSSVEFDKLGNTYIMDQFNYRVRMVSPSGIITTIVGTGVPGYSGDGGPATNAQIARSIGIALDTTNNLYIADYGNNVIRKVSPSGIITTIAGTNVPGYNGDGIPATAAQLNAPSWVTTDKMGNIYISDYANYRIRQISPSGIINTVAGNGVAGSIGDGGPATNAEINLALGVMSDSVGNLYLSDDLNNKIRFVSTSGEITTIAGTGVAGSTGDGGPATSATLHNPSGVAIDDSGNLYIADQLNEKIRKISTSGIITTVVGNGVATFAGDGGPAIDASINSPTGVAFNLSGNLFISDNTNNRIRFLYSCSDSIISQPQADTVLVSNNAIYTVTSTMSSATYQWQQDAGLGFVNLTNSGPYSGVNTSILTITDVTSTMNNYNYRCTISGGPSCSDTTMSAVLVVVNTGISNLYSELINVYPNPVNEKVTIFINDKNAIGDIQIINEIGQLVLQQKIDGNINHLDVSSLCQGIYILKITSGENIVYKKITK